MCGPCGPVVARLCGTNTDDQERWSVFQYKSHVCVSGGAHARLPHTVYTHADVNRRPDHHSSVGLYLQVVNYFILGPPQEDLVSYLDLSCGYFQGDLLAFVAGV